MLFEVREIRTWCIMDLSVLEESLYCFFSLIPTYHKCHVVSRGSNWYMNKICHSNTFDDPDKIMEIFSNSTGLYSDGDFYLVPTDISLTMGWPILGKEQLYYSNSGTEAATMTDYLHHFSLATSL